MYQKLVSSDEIQLPRSVTRVDSHLSQVWPGHCGHAIRSNGHGHLQHQGQGDGHSCDEDGQRRQKGTCEAARPLGGWVSWPVIHGALKMIMVFGGVWMCLAIKIDINSFGHVPPYGRSTGVAGMQIDVKENLSRKMFLMDSWGKARPGPLPGGQACPHSKKPYFLYKLDQRYSMLQPSAMLP